MIRMNLLRVTILLGTVALVATQFATTGTAERAQAPRFTSAYTDLKIQCGPAASKRSLPEGEDMPLRCRGYGGYEIRIDYSAASSILRVQPVRGSKEAIDLATQPINYDRTHKIEWRLANGKPFAVIFRVDKSKSDQPEEMWNPANKAGESLMIKGLKGYDQINFEIDSTTPNANMKAREMADEAYAKKN